MEELVSLRMGVGLTTKKFGLMKAMMPHVDDLSFLWARSDRFFSSGVVDEKVLRWGLGRRAWEGERENQKALESKKHTGRAFDFSINST
jgi:hypothetical protein